MKVRQSHDKNHDILSFRWSVKFTDYSEEIVSSEGHNFVIDYDKKGRIIGIEIFDWDKGRLIKKRIPIKKRIGCGKTVFFDESKGNLKIYCNPGRLCKKCENQN